MPCLRFAGLASARRDRRATRRVLASRRSAAHRPRENGDLLDLGRKRTDDIEARHVHQFAQLLEAEVGVTARDERADGDAGRRLHKAWRDDVGDAPALQEAREMRAARTRRGADAARGPHGVANSPLAADVRLAYSDGDRDRSARPRDVDTAPSTRRPATSSASIAPEPNDEIEDLAIAHTPRGGARLTRSLRRRWLARRRRQLGQHAARGHRRDTGDRRAGGSLDRHRVAAISRCTSVRPSRAGRACCTCRARARRSPASRVFRPRWLRARRPHPASSARD